jgi:hypothetical protein
MAKAYCTSLVPVTLVWAVCVYVVVVCVLLYVACACVDELREREDGRLFGKLARHH